MAKRKKVTPKITPVELLELVPQAVEIEAVFEEREFDSKSKRRQAENRALRDGTDVAMHKVQIGRRLPCLLITTPAAFNDEIEAALRAFLGDAMKKHFLDGKLYIEMGTSDELIKSTIAAAKDFLKGHGVSSVESVEFSPHVFRHQW